MNDIIGAAKVGAMLVGVLKEFEVSEESAPMAAAYTEEEGWHVGLNLPKLSKAKRLADLVRNTGSNEVPGWFGYEAEVKNKYRRAVWFYCADESKANPLKVGLSANGYKVTDQKEIDEYTFSVTSDVIPEDRLKTASGLSEFWLQR
jgi:hypothetical protein